MDIGLLTLIHIALSLAGIFTGFLVIGGMLCAQRMPRLTAVFLATTTLNSATGYLFPAEKVLPAHIVGAISLVVLAVAIAALYRFRLAGRWRTAYVVSACVAQYLNVFVLVVQMFQKVPALQALAPTQAEAPFAVTQLSLLALFVALGVASVRIFRSA